MTLSRQPPSTTFSAVLAGLLVLMGCTGALEPDPSASRSAEPATSVAAVRSPATAPAQPANTPLLATDAPTTTPADGPTGTPAAQEATLPAASPAVLVAAGRLARCGRLVAAKTAGLVAELDGIVLTLGDHAYPNGSREAFEECYAPTWGRFRERTRPVPGNHDYQSPGAGPYFAYFGERAGNRGEGWYSYDAGAWRMIALNSECDQLDGCGPGSAQYEWLRQELAVHPSRCLLAYWHRPVFSSGIDGGEPWTTDLLELLYEAGADLLLTGDDHLYERLRPVDPQGRPDSARGMRMINVGTGGSSLDEYGGPPLASNEVRDNTSHGVLRLELRDDGYEWEFVPVRADGFRDRGADSCR